MNITEILFGLIILIIGVLLYLFVMIKTAEIKKGE